MYDICTICVCMCSCVCISTAIHMEIGGNLGHYSSFETGSFCHLPLCIRLAGSQLPVSPLTLCPVLLVHLEGLCIGTAVSGFTRILEI